MLTNIIAYLHTTAAYQSAALQLMVGQANFDARQLHLKEPLPIVVSASTNDWNIAMPPYGVAGSFATANYNYYFNSGKLFYLQVKNVPRGPEERQPSVLDTNTAVQLAREWLAALSVDVAALDAKYPPTVRFTAPFQPRTNSAARRSPNSEPGRARSLQAGFNNRRREPARPTNYVERVIINTNNARLPVYMVAWGAPERTRQAATNRAASRLATPQVTVEIMGSTKQCLGLHVYNLDLIKAPPLRVTNAGALLGPPPPPQHYVEEFLGGKTAYATVAQPDKALVWLIGSSPDDPQTKTNRSSALTLTGASATAVSQALTDFNSYSWLGDKACAPDYGVRLRFTKGNDVVDFSWCDNCDHVEVTHNGSVQEKDFDAARPVMAKTLKALFPNDEIIRNLGAYAQNPTP